MTDTIQIELTAVEALVVGVNLHALVALREQVAKDKSLSTEDRQVAAESAKAIEELAQRFLKVAASPSYLP